MTQFIPSPHQAAFFKELTEGSRSIVVDAVTGSGKTTTIVHSTGLLPPGYLVLFLAFNKKIQEELERRLPSTVQCATFHSYCYRALQRALPKRPELNKDKIRDLLKENLKWSDFELYGQFCQKLIGLAKSIGIGTELVESPLRDSGPWRELIARFCMTGDSEDFDESRAIAIAQACLEDSNDNISSIDFDDMLYLALLRKVVFDKAGFCFVDEAQDTNGVQRELLKRMRTPDVGRIIAVGDPHQSIYGFRGADSSAMDLIQSDFNAIRLPLSVSYRCSKAVVLEAQKYL